MIHIDIEITRNVETMSVDVEVGINEFKSTVGDPFEIIASQQILGSVLDFLKQAGKETTVDTTSLDELRGRHDPNNN